MCVFHIDMEWFLSAINSITHIINFIFVYIVLFCSFSRGGALTCLGIGRRLDNGLTSAPLSYLVFLFCI
jgi:hypothetical protein